MGACEGVGFYPSPHDVKPRGFDVPWGPGWHSYCAHVINLGSFNENKWLVADGTAVGPPDRAEISTFGVILTSRFFGQFRLYFWSGATL